MLPKIQQPIFSLFLPLSKKTIKYRPMVVREEKMLLLAKESKEYEDIINNVAAVVNNCLVDTDIDIWSIPLVEFEFIFINIRAKSISSTVSLKYYDTYDRKITHDVEIDVSKIKIEIPENFDSKVMLNDSLGITFKLPTLSMTKNLPNTSQDNINVVDVSFDVIRNSIGYIFDSEEIYNVSDYSKEEISDFMESLSAESFAKVESFFKNLPTLKHRVSFKNSKGEDVNIELTRLEDFF
jgi:uncharacterized lipoprotein YehR (DUF1307 family)